MNHVVDPSKFGSSSFHMEKKSNYDFGSSNTSFSCVQRVIDVPESPHNNGL
jgi:hypothetical protein